MPRPEDKFRSALVKEMLEYGMLAVPIETGATTAAFPDVYFCYEFTGVIELKVETFDGPKTTRKIDFRPGQYRFLSRNEKLGGRSFVGIKYANGYLFMSIEDVDEVTRRPLCKSSIFMPRLDIPMLWRWLSTFVKHS